MASMFESAWREASGARRLRLALRAFASLVLHGVLLRLKSSQPPRAGRPEAHPPSPRGRARVPLRGLGHDLRVATRGLAARPAFTAVILLTLTLGLGANVAIFSFVNALLLRPLPYGDPGRLVQLSETAPDVGTMDVSFPDFHHWASRSEVFSEMFAFDDTRFHLSGADPPALVEGAVVTPGFFEVLGVTPALGRDFTPLEGRPGADAVAILGFGLWRDRFGGDPSVLGRAVILDGRTRTVVGVAPPGFHFPEVAHLWVPLAADPERADPDAYDLDVIARLAPGRSLADARAEGSRIAGELARRHPQSKAGIGAQVYPLRAADVPVTLAFAALVLLAAACLVLLIATVNVTNLLRARGEERWRELAVRRALGASRGLLVRQMLVESLLLAVLGGAGSLAIAVGAGRIFPRLLPDETPFWLRFDLDWRVFAWGAGATLLACLASGLGPALRATRAGATLAASLRSPRDRARGAVIAVEVALAMVLLIGAGLMMRALHGLRAVDPGLDPEGVLVLSVAFPPGDEGSQAERAARQREIVERVGALREVERVAATSSVPLLGSPDEVAFEAERSSMGRRPIAALTAVTEGYFATMGIPLLAGRLPSATETWSGAAVAVVSESIVERLWPEGDPIGRRIRHGNPGSRSPTVAPDRPWSTVIGVVGDVRVESLSRPPREALYVPFGGGSRVLTLVARTRSSPLPVADAVRRQVREVDGDLPLLEPTTMAEAMAFSTWTQQLAARLLSAFGALALVLALVGIHGVVAFATRRRTREIGIRIALGATPSAVSWTVAARTAGAVLLGLAVGGAVGVAASRALTSLLYGVEPGDPTTVLTAGTLLGAAGLLAAYLPSRRAARADPMSSLRREP